MEAYLILQITASIAALMCSGGGLAMWLYLITKGDISRLALLKKKPVILCQAGIGTLVFVGSIASAILAIYRPTFRGGKRHILIINKKTN
jgi:hypothetical protein